MCGCLFMSAYILGELRADGDGPHCIVLWARPTALAATVIAGLPLNCPYLLLSIIWKLFWKL